MKIKDFITKSMMQDKRNIFERVERDIKASVPDTLKEFYLIANPVDVEVSMNNYAVQFIPLDQLDASQSEFSLGDNRFVFASCNGDPIYVYDGKIYSCCHGIGKVEDELMAEDLGSFFDLID